jgi:hypothetical protein
MFTSVLSDPVSTSEVLHRLDSCTDGLLSLREGISDEELKCAWDELSRLLDFQRCSDSAEYVPGLVTHISVWHESVVRVLESRQIYVLADHETSRIPWENYTVGCYWK